MTMGRIIRVCWAAATLALTPTSGLAQMMPNQIVSGAYTFSSYSPDVLIVSPGEVVTLFTTVLNVPDAVATETPLPISLSGVSVLLRVVGAQDTRDYPTALPILSIFKNNVVLTPSPGIDCSASANSNFIYCANTAITVQIPNEGVCVPSPISPDRNCTNPPFHELPPLLLLNVSANGINGPDLPVQLVLSTPHILNSCEAIFGPYISNGSPRSCYPQVVHGDGTFVTTTSPG
jgi:hypothetical protein